MRRSWRTTTPEPNCRHKKQAPQKRGASKLRYYKLHTVLPGTDPASHDKPEFVTQLPTICKLQPIASAIRFILQIIVSFIAINNKTDFLMRE